MEECYFWHPRVLNADIACSLMVVYWSPILLAWVVCLIFSPLGLLLIWSDPIFHRPISTQLIWELGTQKKANSLRVCFYQYLLS